MTFYLHSFLPWDPKVASGQEASNRMSGQMMYPTLLAQLSHNRVDPRKSRLTLMRKRNFTSAIKFPKSCMAIFLFFNIKTYKDVNIKWLFFTNDFEDLLLDCVEGKYLLFTLQKKKKITTRGGVCSRRRCSFCLWLCLKFTHVRPFCERLDVLVPRYLHANRVTLHTVEIGVLCCGAVKEFAPE